MQKDGDVIRLEHQNYFKKYCSNLPNLEQKECNKQLGMNFADVFNYDKKKLYRTNTWEILQKYKQLSPWLLWNSDLTANDQLWGLL